MIVRPYRSGDIMRLHPPVPGDVFTFDRLVRQHDSWAAETEAGVLLAVGGLLDEGSALRAWAQFSGGWQKYAVPISSSVRRHLRHAERPVIAFSQCGLRQAEGWLRVLGFVPEAVVADYMGSGMGFLRWRHERR